MSSKKYPYTRVGILRVEDVLDNIGKKASCKFIIKNTSYYVNLISARYRVFKFKGVVCAICGAKGTFFAIERHKKSDTEKFHLNLYTLVNGKEILMTKDHIWPLSKGGSNHIDNLQPMCVKCNGKKNDVLPELDVKFKLKHNINQASLAVACKETLQRSL